MSENNALSYWEDFTVGDVQEFGNMLVTEADIVRFATEFDPQPFHVDAEAAKSSLFKGLCASGWHTCAMAMRIRIRRVRVSRRPTRPSRRRIAAWKSGS